MRRFGKLGFCHLDQLGQQRAEITCLLLAEGKIDFAEDRIQPVVDPLCGGIGLKGSVLGADFILRLLDRWKQTGGKKREDR